MTTAATPVSVSVPTFRDGEHGGETMTLTGPDEVAGLAELLAQPWADSGTVDTGDASLVVHLTPQWGYLDYYGDAGVFSLDGDPGSPEVLGEHGHRAGEGLPADRVVAALREFVATGGELPRGVPWRES